MFPPNIIGSPDSPDPITITLLLFDSESLIVASIPLSFRILVVNDELNILFASALPWASILTLSASFLALSNLNSYSKDSCSCLSFLSIASLTVALSEPTLDHHYYVHIGRLSF